MRRIMTLAVAGAVLAAVAGLAIARQLTTSHAPQARAGCGSFTINARAGTPVVADPGSLTCFSAAARACERASISMHEMDIGTRLDYEFDVVPGRTPCLVTESRQRQSASAQHTTTVSTTSCAGPMMLRGGGVYLDCDPLIFVIPASTAEHDYFLPFHAASTLPPVSCGSITSGALRNGNAAAVTCFKAAARACRPGSIGVREVGADTQARDVFSVAPGANPCRVTEVSQTYFASGNSYGPVTTQSCRVTAGAGGGLPLSCDGQRVLTG